MLPLCFGEATKVCAYLLDADKTYRVTARLGSATDTGDADGAGIGTAAVPELSFDEWDEVLQGFMGDSMQIPPMYSALKKDGKRLYELARKGEIVERDPRPIRIDQIRLLEAAGTRLVFRVSCSKGTYVRTLVEDIAGKAGTVAHTVRLHRETVGRFSAEDMQDLATIEAQAEQDQDSLRDSLLPPDVALTALPAVDLDEDEAQKFCGGQVIQVATEQENGLKRVYETGRRFLGVGELTDNGQLAPRRVFNTSERTP
jgi:tRNA pseudouridine55 synthase